MQSPPLLLASLVLAVGAQALSGQGISNELWRLDGKRASERLGTSLAQLDDIDGDAFGDYLLGGPSNAFAGNTDWGVALVVSGRTGKIIRTHTGKAAYDYFGSTVARLGDLDGDGVDEYAVSASRTFLGSSQGSVYVYSGKTGALRVEIKSGTTLSKSDFGSSIGAIGDLNADGIPDLLIGAPLAWRSIQAQNLQVGCAYAFSGKTGNKILDLAGTGTGDLFGHAVLGLGDLDLDGVADILVAAPQSRVGLAGYVRIFSGKTGAVIQTLAGSKDADHFGLAVSSSPDLDGDKQADFVVGAPQTNSLPLGDGGYVRAFSSSTFKPLWTRAGNAKGEGFGYALASLGDVDGDGVSDLAATTHVSVFPTSPGEVRILSGKTGSIFHTWAGKTLGDEFGNSVAAAGDRNADGRPDVLVGMPLHSTTGSLEIGSCRVMSSWPLSLVSDRPDVSVLMGGKQRLDLDAGVLRAGKVFVILGSQSGIHPGLTLGNRNLPLNWDPYLGLMLRAPNALILPSVGVLDSNGRATAWFTLPPQGNLALQGIHLDHAYVVLGTSVPWFAWTSNPVSLDLTR